MILIERGEGGRNCRDIIWNPMPVRIYLGCLKKGAFMKRYYSKDFKNLDNWIPTDSSNS